MGMFEKAKGVANEAAGQVEESYGEATNSHQHRLEGQARQIYGKGLGAASDAMDTAKQQVETNPLTSVAISAGIGLIIGYLLGRK